MWRDLMEAAAVVPDSLRRGVENGNNINVFEEVD